MFIFEVWNRFDFEQSLIRTNSAFCRHCPVLLPLVPEFFSLCFETSYLEVRNCDLMSLKYRYAVGFVFFVLI